ncbi:hypothetical protein [Campylobacter sp. LH-2024]|uniref:hypothetical protein n=1 Tax=Campylobacter sp. LH-2024 TaxID=3239825 RepID=UPI003B8213B7
MKDGDPLKNNEFKHALIDFIFKNQNRIGVDICANSSYKIIRRYKPLSYEDDYNNFKKKEKKAFEENRKKFEEKIKVNMTYKDVS